MIVALAFFLCLASAGAALPTLPSLRLFRRHSDDAVTQYMKVLPSNAFNHAHAGESCDEGYDSAAAAPVAGFAGLTSTVAVGKGRRAFKRASEALFAFEMINGLGWARVALADATREVSVYAKEFGSVLPRSQINNLHVPSFLHQMLSANPSRQQQQQQNLNLCTNVRCYGLLWSLNPCRLLAGTVLRDCPVKAGRVSQLAYSTLKGHLIAGEERFRVTHSASSDEVLFEVHSFTRGSGLLGSLAMPFIRPVQRAFFSQQGRLMARIVEGQKPA